MVYVLQVLTGKEEEVARKLQEEGIKSLLPRERRLIRTRGSWTEKVYCLIPGYVFMEMMTYTAENYYRVKKLPGAVKLLGDPANPSHLSYLEAEWILALTGYQNEPIPPTRVRIREDGSAELLSGVLRSFEGRIQKLDRRSRRATFSISILGESKEVTLSIALEGEEGIETEEGLEEDSSENSESM